ncbi:MAG: hypothetical protein ACRDLB_07125 [Actinomycetota bacterium]
MADEMQDQKDFNEKVIAKIKDDPDFLGHLLEDAPGTLQSAGLIQSESDLADQEGEAPEGDFQEGAEVEGHRYHRYITWYRTCRFWYRGYYWHRR